MPRAHVVARTKRYVAYRVGNFVGVRRRAIGSQIDGLYSISLRPQSPVLLRHMRFETTNWARTGEATKRTGHHKGVAGRALHGQLTCSW